MQLKSEPNKREHKGKSIIEFPSDYVVVDLETTGYSPLWDRIIEIGAIKVHDGKIIDTYQQLVNPCVEISEFVQEMTGITNEMIHAEPVLETVLPDFKIFLDNNIIIGHNVGFDVNFLYDAYEIILDEYLTQDYIDTLRIARKLYPEMESHRLCDVVNHLNVSGSSFHRALNDCEYTYKIFEIMKTEIDLKFDSRKDFSSLFRQRNKKTNRNLTKMFLPSPSEIDETHLFYGKICVFTGTINKYTRDQCYQIVANFGGTCADNLTKKTNFLIIGNMNYCSTIKDGKSNKQKKAEKLIESGSDLQIISEDVFYDLVEK